MLKTLVKEAFRSAGLKIERRDRLEESIPADYNHSPFLPRIYRGRIHTLMYWRDLIEQVREIDGDIVECGVSIGQGALLFRLVLTRPVCNDMNRSCLPLYVHKSSTRPIVPHHRYCNTSHLSQQHRRELN